MNSHVRAVQRGLGARGLDALREAVGHPLQFAATEDVPTSLEALVLEEAVRLLSVAPSEEEVPRLAGRLHYRNFRETPWARVLFTLFPRDYGFMLRHAHTIASRVFNHVVVEAKDLAPRSMLIRLVNSGYPLDHFQGFLEAWLQDFGNEGQVVAQQPTASTQEYLVQWEPT